MVCPPVFGIVILLDGAEHEAYARAPVNALLTITFGGSICRAHVCERETPPACPAWGRGSPAPRSKMCAMQRWVRPFAKHSRRHDHGAICAVVLSSYRLRRHRGGQQFPTQNDTQPSNRCTTLIHRPAPASKFSTRTARSLGPSASLTPGGSGGLARAAPCLEGEPSGPFGTSCVPQLDSGRLTRNGTADTVRTQQFLGRSLSN